MVAFKESSDLQCFHELSPHYLEKSIFYWANLRESCLLQAGVTRPYTTVVKKTISRDIDISVVIPCYRSPESFGKQILLTCQALEMHTNNFEIILICDSCPDDTWSKIRSSVLNRRVVGYLLGKNIGQHRATLFGISKAKGDVLVTMDDDGQHKIEAITRLMEKYKEGFDLVYAQPLIDEHGIFRNFFSTVIKKVLSRLKLVPNAEKISSYRMINSKIFEDVSFNVMSDFNLDSFLLSRSDKVESVNVPFNKREEGKSTYSLAKLIKHTINLTFSRADNLMLSVLTTGLIGLFISVLLLAFSTWNVIWGNIKVPGYSSLVIFLSFSFSINFLILGIIGRLSYMKIQSQDNKNQEIWVREALNL
jgi:glycosyltransferase involved in cell wall biosynthesis